MTAPLSDEALAALRVEHALVEAYKPVRQTLGGWVGGNTEPECWKCRRPWPCDAARLLDHIAATSEAARQKWERLLSFVGHRLVETGMPDEPQVICPGFVERDDSKCACGFVEAVRP